MTFWLLRGQVGPAHGGLPVGFQLIAPYAEDEVLFRIAAEYRQAMPIRARWPALADPIRPMEEHLG